MSLIPTGITALLLLWCTNLLLVAGDSATITTTTTTPAVNEQFTVTVMLATSSGFSCWGQLLTWDTSKIRLDSQQSLTSPFGNVVADSRSLSAMRSSGQVRTGGYYEAAGPSYPDNAPASGAVAVFTFTRIAAGSTDIAGPVKSGTAPFGLVQIDASGVERSPSGSLLTLTDPLTTQVGTSAPATNTSSGSKSCGLGSGIAGLALMGFLAFASLRRRQP